MSVADRGGALVTGGARRIGRALCEALAKAGYAVAVHYRDEARAGEARATAQAILDRGGRARPVAANLSDDDDVAGLIAAARAGVGPLTLLVNNASTFQDDRIGDLTHQSWDRHMQPNLWAPVRLAQAFAAAEFGPDADPQVVNMLDQRVLRPNPQFFSYTVSKAALHVATGILAQGLAPRIRVNAIAPGPTLASVHQSPEEFAAEMAATPLQRGSDSDQIVAALLYLIDARAVTGQTLAVDGGQHLAWRTPDILKD